MVAPLCLKKIELLHKTYKTGYLIRSIYVFTKEEIVELKSVTHYLIYQTVVGSDIDVFLYDPIKEENIYKFEQTYSLHNSIASNQFGIDYVKSMLYFSLHYQKNASIRIVYQSEGIKSQFHQGGNLGKIVDSMTEWSINRVIDGMFIYWTANEEGGTRKRIQPGSFIYDGKFYVYPGGIFDIRMESPPTIKNTFKSYLLFINSEWISGYVYSQNKMLNKIGIIHSNVSHSDMEVTLNSVNAKYEILYETKPLKIAYIHLYLMDSMDYEIWIDYPKDSRGIN